MHTLLNGKWQMIAYTGSATYMGKDTTADLYALMQQCDKDDFILFFRRWQLYTG